MFNTNWIFLLFIFSFILQNGYYTDSAEDLTERPHKIDLIKSVLEYTELHYASPITLNDLANVAGMNPKYFCRFFRSITHQTPIEYVNMYRIEKAAQMLHSTRLPITDICMECGFNDSSNFIKVFRKYKGMTPMQYRKGWSLFIYPESVSYNGLGFWINNESSTVNPKHLLLKPGDLIFFQCT